MNITRSLLGRKMAALFAMETGKRIVVPAGVAAAVAVWTATPVSWSRVVWASVAVVVLPLLFFAPVKSAVAKRSNVCNALLLFLFVAFDAISSAWAVRWSVDSWLAALVAAGMVVAGLFYDVWIMTFALKLEGN